MAGIGFELRKIFGRKTLVSNIWGSIYATMTTIGPSVLFAILVLVLKAIIDRSNIPEIENRFFISSFTYLFLIAILVASLFNTAVSRYISDCIFKKEEKRICSSVFGVLTCGSVITGLFMLILCIGMFRAGGVSLTFLVIYYFFGNLVANTYNLIIYISALKQYKEVTLSFFAGLVIAIPIFLLCFHVFEIHIIMAAYSAMACGFFVINLLLVFLCIRAFGWSNVNCFLFLYYFKKFPKLTISGFSYMLGFYITSIIYWFLSDMSEQVSIFRTAPNYDLAMFLAIVINMPALVIFVVKSETAFFDKYVSYLSAINNGSYELIEKEHDNMCNTIRFQLFYVYEVQLIVTIVLICLVNVFFPYLNIHAGVLNMFMLLSMGVYCVFCMYFTIIFLYYFEDHTGAAIAPCIFLAVTICLAVVTVFIGKPYYPLPILIGGIVGWIASYLFLQYRLIHLNSFLMCK